MARSVDTGLSFRDRDAAPVKRGGIYKTDEGQLTFTDGKGNKFWFVDTSGGDVTITLPKASDAAPDTKFHVKRMTAGADALSVTAEEGDIDGASSHSLPTQYDKACYVSDGENYWIV